MAATNTNSESGRTFYKLKEKEEQGKKTGELRFFKQEKANGSWGDGESFNQLDGYVKEIEVKEYEYDKKIKQSLIVRLQDGTDSHEFSLGFQSSIAQGILNTLSGENPRDLIFSCGKPRQSGDKVWPTLYINRKDGATNEANRTTWKYKFEELPKVTKVEDEDGNVIKKGAKAANEFWMNVVAAIQSKLKASAVNTTASDMISKPKPSFLDDEDQNLPF